MPKGGSQRSSHQTVDFLLELGCEEIPARFLLGLSETLKVDLLNALDKARIGYDLDQVTVLYTYRRLVIRIHALSVLQADQSLQFLGPPLTAAKDSGGEWLPAAIGFAKKCGVLPDQLVTKVDAKGRECLYYEMMQQGQPVQSCLPELIQAVIYNLHLPIAMRWGSETRPFFRTVQWLCCLCDSELVPVTVWDVMASNQTRGHRFLTKDSAGSIEGAWVTIASPSDYVSTLQMHFVMVDPNQRRQLIIESHSQCDRLNDLLITEVVGLVEWPTPLTISFDSTYLSLPENVLIQVMEKHQKYFPIWESKKLTNNCLVIADNVSDLNRKTIISGNQRVLHARFSDALYFWKTDQSESLATYVPQLEKVVFQQGLGTLLDKTKRIQHLVKQLNQENGLKLDEVSLDRAAYLCKADLVTQMVYEFPALQGVIGSFYAQKTESDVIANALREHYLPLQSQGQLPESPMGAVLALADRIDTIVACYVNDQIPTSSKDPLGVRRAMLGVLAILDHFQWSINLVEFINFSYSCFGKSESNKDQLSSFFLLRIKHYLIEAGIPHDIAAAVLKHGLVDFLGTLRRARMLLDYTTNQLAYKRLVDAGVRCFRLLKDQPLSEEESVNMDLFEHDSEGVLYQAALAVDPEPTLADLAQLVPMIETYFDSVLVMADDEHLRQNRLQVINTVGLRFSTFAAFEELVV
mgnify:CR=1 FL=1